MRLLLVTAFVLCSVSGVLSEIMRDKVFVLETLDGNDTKKMAVVVTWEEGKDGEEATYGCEIFTDKELIEEIMNASKEIVVRRPTQQEINDIYEECTIFSLRRKRRAQINTEENRDGGVTTTPVPAKDEGYTGWNIIYPGTKWCGPGSIATNYDDLGFHQDTDRCCRTHDNCNGTLGPGEKIGDLPNNSQFTQLSCACDDALYGCLDRINSLTSNTIGNAYFNIAKRPCYVKDYPLTGKCLKYKTFLRLVCIEYERDTSVPKQYQWKPAKKYRRIPLPIPLTVTLPF